MIPEKQRQVWYKVVCLNCKRKYKTLPKCLFKPLLFNNCTNCGGEVRRKKDK